MKRIDIIYGADRYSVGGREFDDLKREIQEGIASGPLWLEVNEGEGAPRAAYLMLLPGVPIALIPITDDSDISAGMLWDADGNHVTV